MKKNNLVKPSAFDQLDILQNTLSKETSTRSIPPIEQTTTILQKDSYYLKKEELQLTQGSSFEGSMKDIVSILFPNASIKELENKGNLYYFSIQTQKKSFALIAYNQNKKTIKLLYPVTYENATLTPVAQNKEDIIDITLDPKTIILDNFIRYKR